jgi:RecB family endonuclease NucS
MATDQRTSTGWQAICVASLIGQCESAVSSGRLTAPAEEAMRLLIAETLSAFNMHHNQQHEVA